MVLAGCGAQSVLDAGAAADSPTPALVLKAAYELEGQQRQVIFLDAFDMTDEQFDALMDDLETTLDVDVLPAEAAFRGDPDLPALTPIDPETGEVGVSLTLQGIAEVDSLAYEATISYARSGLDGGEVTLVLERRAGQWVVIERYHGPQG